MTRNNTILIIDQHGIDKAELAYALDQLLDLLFRVRARVAVVRPEFVDRPLGEMRTARHGALKHNCTSLLTGGISISAFTSQCSHQISGLFL